MRVLVNGLSATSLSGQYVLLGHLRQLAGWTAGQHEFVVLYHSGNVELVRELGPNVSWRLAPESTRRWPGRLLWETLSLERVAREVGADLLFSPTGTTLPRFALPQVTLAQNPWCFARSLHRTLAERVKAGLQRSAYRRAVRQAALLVYNSEHMRQAYRTNAGRDERHGVIAYQGLDDDTFASAEALREDPRNRYEVLVVSVMAAWKNVEAVVSAVAEVRRRGTPAVLTLVGPWPDAAYERRIRERIAQDGVAEAVRIVGCVSREDLYRHYARARVFCLLSRCESFGIPALEAQAFGTPGVVTAPGAMPEVCGMGCVGVSPDDVSSTADALQRLLTDESHWAGLSQSARANAARFQWSECSQPLLRMFELPTERTVPHAVGQM